ncbi:MAG: adenylate/guanylate cyclase domain-containing protein [Bacteroidota bacterium]|nr:adenylate/guanylate cyclase domain-containing protein [Bacteroidota bacterium]
MKLNTLLLLLVFPLFVKTQIREFKSYKPDTTEINALLKEYKEKYREIDDKYIQSFRILFNAFSLSKQANYKRGMIKSSYFLGEYFTAQSNPAKSIEYYYLSLQLAEKENDIKSISLALLGIGLVYYTQKDWSQAQKYFYTALKLNRKIHNLQGISTQQYLLGICASNLKQYSLSRKYLDSALQIKRDLKSEQGINECYMAIADLFKNTLHFDSSLYYYNKAFPYIKASREAIPLSIINCSFAEISYHRKDYNKALYYAIKAKELSASVAYKDASLNPNEILYKIYLAKGDYKNAFENIKEYYSIKDSILNRDVASRISSFQLNYEFEKQQNLQLRIQKNKEEQYNTELKSQERKRKAVSVVAGFCIVLIIVIGFAYRLVSKEKKASEDLLLNILPKETAAELKKFGRALPKNHPGVSIMFSDIENFTNIAEQLSPEDLVETLDFYFKEFDQIIMKYGIEKIKTIGDAYMCVAGLKGDRTPEVEAENIIHAALEMTELNQQSKEKFEEKFGLSLEFRIGIHSGSIISGVVGLKKYAYDIWGDAVNTAARMEQNSQAGRINISGNTFQLVKDKFHFERRGKIAVKNKGDVEMYFVGRDRV